MPAAPEQLAAAVEHHRAGRVAEALRLVERPELENALGTEHARRGELSLAEQCYRRAVALSPGFFKPHNNLGNVLRELGDLEGAAACYQAALRIEPAAHRVHANLGNTLRELGRGAEAAASYATALALAPSAPVAVRLGLTREALGDHEGAARAYRRAEELGEPGAPLLLGVTLVTLDRLDEAIVALRRATAAEPSRVEAHRALGGALERRGTLDEAEASYREATRLAPDLAEARVDLGIALHLAGRPRDALAPLEEAIRLAPDLAAAHQNLGLALKETGSLERALAAFRTAVQLEPGSADGHANLAAALLDRGDIHGAVAALRRALDANPAFAGGHDNLLFTMQYDADFLAELPAEARRFGSRHAAPLTALASDARDARDLDRNPERTLRVGYVSPDFRRHSVASFLEPILRGHDRERFSIVCYSDVARPDEVTRRLAALDLTFRDLRGASDAQAAALIREDRVDVLVDLAGHSSGNRLLVFARRPAPVQVTYLGYPDTTGVEALDYRLTDAVADPPDDPSADARCTETLVRLPRTAWCFAPYEAAEAPAPASAPLARDAPVRFGSFNIFAKVRPEVLAAWVEILRAVSGSTLLVKAKSLADPDLQREVAARFGAAGIARERLEVRGWERGRAQHLGLYQRVDIALDTFPYNGTTTTCEALWMGVPVVTLAGATHASRVGASLLSSVGLADLVAGSTSAYVQKAVDLAGDPDRRRALRSGLRARVASSPLSDAPAFVEALEGAYRAMWRTFCAGRAARPR